MLQRARKRKCVATRINGLDVMNWACCNKRGLEKGMLQREGEKP